MTGPSKAMKAAFPPELSKGAERLTVVVDELVGFEASVIARAIVTELGITEDVVAQVFEAWKFSDLGEAQAKLKTARPAHATVLELAGK